MIKRTHAELLARQELLQNNKKIPLCLVLNNIRSLHNVGAIFRTCDGAGIEKLWLCGITGLPPHAKIEKSSLGAEKVVTWEYREKAVDCIRELKDQGYQIVLLEQTHQSIPYQDFVPRRPVCLVLGNEVEGVEDNILPLADQALEVEMTGLKNSLNVTVACGIAVYHLRNHLYTLALK